MSTEVFVLTGPESCAKTSLANYLGDYFSVPIVPEVARLYLEDKQCFTNYLPSDLLSIAEQQSAMEFERLTGHPEFVVADTDLQVLRIWWQVKYGPLPNRLGHKTDSRKRHYLLCAPTIVWQPDPLRESKDERVQLFNLYLEDMHNNALSYTIIDAQGEARNHQARTCIEQHYS